MTDVNSVNIDSVINSSIEIETKKIDNELGLNSKVKAITNKKVPIAINLYSSLYHSLAFVSLVKQIEKENISIEAISSQGFGSLLAALYAKEKSASYVEWKLFNLLKQLKEKKIYSQHWYELLKDFISNEFKTMKVEQLKVRLLIPEYLNNNLVIHENKRVADVLNRALSIQKENNFYHQPTFYQSHFDKHSIENAFMISFLPEKVTFKNLSGYDWGVVTRYLGFVLNNTESINILKTSSTEALDELTSISDINSMYFGSIKEYVQSMKTQITKWQEENTESFNN
ncbi:MAG: hypothetical protein HON90_05720 [Halobacteriovoraceae bacterium]|nr:hypothetical protein [Halobacteriovoraceae bacterium]